ncbi:MAG: hypothetical protein DI571_05340 [Arsenicicoccus sp.]|nr:MAG: hypothetical protein DI571_05340 [Arsenicicoccus sp.]
MSQPTSPRPDAPGAVTTMTARPPSDEASVHPAPAAPWVRLTRHLLRPALGITLGTVAVLALAWALGVALATREVFLVVAVMSYVGVSTVPWIAFTVLVITVGSAVRQLVHAGFTRRAITVAGLLCALAVGVLFAAGVVVVELAGQAVMEAMTETYFSVGTAPWWAALPALGLLCITAAVCGVLVGASFVRWRGWATLLLPVTAGLPFFAQDVLTRSVTRRGMGAGGPRSWIETIPTMLPPLPTMALCLLVLTLTVAATWWVLRSLPLPPRASA